MYIFKNALKCIGRSKGRNILIGVIVLVIAISSCIGLSIRQAAESAREETINLMNVTAKISFDRAAAMNRMTEDSGEQGFDRSQFANMMGNSSALSLEEYLVYAEAESVKDFYYSMTAYVNGVDNLNPVTSEAEEEEAETSPSEGGFGGMGSMNGMGGGRNRVFGANSDFSIVGYSKEEAMTSFINGNSSVIEGSMFNASTGDGTCIITQELAAFNDLSVGDTISISNPNNEEETYKLTVSGIYTDSSSNTNSFSMFGSTSTDPANQIYMSYSSLEKIIDDSTETVKTITEEDTAEETSVMALTGTLEGTYVFADVESYEAFEIEVRELGLDETYVVNSTDVSSFESSLIPLNTLSKMAGYFLVVILVIGAIILVVLNIFNVRERKYEIGVLTAMGMKKGKVALQFLSEIFIVTIIAIVIGVGIGGISSVPVTNALLENQVASQNKQSEQIEQNFGRGDSMGGNIGGNRPTNNGGYPGFISNMFGTDSETVYVTEISSAMNLTVVFQMLAIGILLTLISGTVSMLFVMRYEPLKILANRD